MNAVIAIIHAHHGAIYESAGLVFGFFSDPTQAMAAMSLILSQGFAVARVGSQLTVET